MFERDACGPAAMKSMACLLARRLPYRLREEQANEKSNAGLVLVAGSAFAAPRISVGIEFSAPAPMAVVPPACPGPGYVWVDGYDGPSGVWMPAFWRAPIVVAPRFREAHPYAFERGRDFHRDFRR